MKLNQLSPITGKGKKRVGRGLGSGRGKTAGRGMKGQKARGKIPLTFIGGTLPLYRKLPLRKGKGNPKVSTKFKVINLSALNVFKSQSVVDLEALINSGLIKKQDLKSGVKILAEGEIKQALIIKLPVSKSARERIEKVGGRIENA